MFCWAQSCQLRGKWPNRQAPKGGRNSWFPFLHLYGLNLSSALNIFKANLGSCHSGQQAWPWHWTPLAITVPLFLRVSDQNLARNVFMHLFKSRISRHMQQSFLWEVLTLCPCLATDEILTTPVLGVRGRLISFLERCWQVIWRMKLGEKLALIGYWSFNKSSRRPATQTIT